MAADDDHTLFSTGVTLFNKRNFFDAHDAWEEVWMETRGKKRLFYQGLIQAAVAYYHGLNANNAGASNLMQKAVVKLEAFLPAENGILLQPLLPVLRMHARRFTDHREEFRVVIKEEELPILEQTPHIS